MGHRDDPDPRPGAPVGQRPRTGGSGGAAPVRPAGDAVGRR
ncbi:protein of unassigned function [Methylobacterium oryzae CBMB20]|uniref:Protein of unassigned function n=1 Tax=Methylobacterium oryzae CBMB20 TaxID=693986 RepID=A0A089P4I7_9HYPH|nr:protein of unassigned function [Methylobacterium oryzae CBMB20]